RSLREIVETRPSVLKQISAGFAKDRRQKRVELEARNADSLLFQTPDGRALTFPQKKCGGRRCPRTGFHQWLKQFQVCQGLLATAADELAADPMARVVTGLKHRHRNVASSQTNAKRKASETSSDDRDRLSHTLRRSPLPLLRRVYEG